MEKIPDHVYNDNWDTLLKVFHGINNTDKDAKDKYNQLKELSKSKILTERQHEGINDRCNWQIRLIDNPDEAKKINDLNTRRMSYNS